MKLCCIISKLFMLQCYQEFSLVNFYTKNYCNICFDYLSYLFRRGRSKSADSRRVHASLQRISPFHCILCHSRWRASFVYFESKYILLFMWRTCIPFPLRLPRQCLQFAYKLIITLASNLPPPVPSSLLLCLTTSYYVFFSSSTSPTSTSLSSSSSLTSSSLIFSWALKLIPHLFHFPNYYLHLLPILWLVAAHHCSFFLWTSTHW